MRSEPQAADYQPDPAIGEIAEWIGAPVEAAHFPQTALRFRNNRWAKTVGLADLNDEQWLDHFGQFSPLPGNLPQPLALKYHGHQFRNYNPDIGDGRGFLFAQLRGGISGRLLDLGTKGSGQTPFSRTGDGRLTLKGAMREVLATEQLEALGVNTSKTFSVIETGEELWRDDEPSPTRSAVMVRLSHSHIRIGTFQRLLAMDKKAELEQLVEYCLKHFPGPLPPKDAPGRDEPAVILMHQVVERMADQSASYMVAGFVHGVLNTDNMNITGESFDYGPWRWLPRWDPGFTAASFDYGGLYAFGRQPEAMQWNCGQFAVALRMLADSEPLIAAINRYGELYMAAVARRWCWRMGIQSQGVEKDTQLIAASEKVMRESGVQPDQFFFDHRGGRSVGNNTELSAALKGYAPVEMSHQYWEEDAPQNMVFEEVERIWAAIDERDDWAPFETKIEALRSVGDAHGEPPKLAGHL
ncbi:MAG: protein adenylyltransferase SelO family protein [Erythrobacter sp.]